MCCRLYGQISMLVSLSLLSLVHITPALTRDTTLQKPSTFQLLAGYC